MEQDIGWIAGDVDGINPLWSLAITMSVTNKRYL
jgi:hypothetical protein